MPDGLLPPSPILSATTLLETPRLLVRGFTMKDLDQIHEVLGDPRVMWTEESALTREQTRQWLEAALGHYRTDGMGECAVVLRSAGRIIGDCGLVMRDIEDERIAEFNWDLRRDAWGHGYATEAAAAVLSHATAVGLARACALIKAHNERSKAVARRLGLRFARSVVWESAPWDLWLIELA
jgi:[ribosomal protein S5]-alanine N-acetyltransferase